MVSILWQSHLWFFAGFLIIVTASIFLGSGEKMKVLQFIAILFLWGGVTIWSEGSSRIYGKMDYLGAPIMFNDLQKNSAYKIVKVIDGTYALIQYEDNEPKLIKNIPKELADMGEGATFEIKDIPSVTSGEKLVVPMLHPH